MQKRAPERITDMRQAFDDNEVNAVVIATPEHWHALATVRACQAGKDVYVVGAIQSTHSGRREAQNARINVAPGEDGLRPTSRFRARGLVVVRMGVVANGSLLLVHSRSSRYSGKERCCPGWMHTELSPVPALCFASVPVAREPASRLSRSAGSGRRVCPTKEPASDAAIHTVHDLEFRIRQHFPPIHTCHDSSPVCHQDS